VCGVAPMVGDALRNTVSCRGSSPSLRPSTPFGYSAVRGASVLDSPAGEMVVGSCRTIVDGAVSAEGDGFRDISEGRHVPSWVSDPSGGITGILVPTCLALFRAATRRQCHRPVWC
jgi:hypothetical protein